MTLPTADVIGQYQIIEHIGSGGMATVYKAYHARLDRYVALKIMHQSFLQDPSFRARFEREARIVGRLEHPNIVPVFDYDEFNGQPYLVMKYIEGTTLKDEMRKEPLTLPDILHLIPKIADALTYAHTQGVLHRDIKPSNIIIDSRGEPHLTDFGLARMAQSGESTMSADMMLGTPQYISPEQAQGLPDLDARTDVYSLGIILYELVTGRVPFTGDTTYAIVHKQINAAPPRPSELNPEIPPEVERVLLRTLAKERSERYPTPNALIEAFQQAVSSDGLTELDEGRASTAEARGREISERTPGGSKYVSVPTPVNWPSDDAPPGVRIQTFFQQLGERIRQAAGDIQRELEANDVMGKIAEGLRQAKVEIQNAFSDHAAARDPVKERERDRAKLQKLLDEDWGVDHETIRQRVNRRIHQRNGFVAHLAAYMIVSTAAFAVQPVIQEVAREALTTAQTGTVNVAALAKLNGAAILALLWGGGVISHLFAVLYNRARWQDVRRRALQVELATGYGPDWQERISSSDYRRVRSRVENRYKHRREFISHAIGAVMLSAAAYVAWPPVQEMLNSVDGIPFNVMEFPLPLLVLLLAMFSVLVHGIILGFSSLTGADARERAIRREIEREMSTLSMAYSAAKLKNDELAEKPKHDEIAPAVRLTGDGELTDSYVAQWADAENDARQGR